jgi:ubiquitin carboxyl-terminal hydrolase 7
MIELMKPKLSFAQSEIQDGDVICFQVDLPEKEWVSSAKQSLSCELTPPRRAHDIESQGLHSNPIHYYDFLQNRVMIVFRPKLDEVDNEHPEFSLVLSKKQNYDIVRFDNS